MNEKPGYYAIIPAGVRYDKSICPNAKLLYCEISALSNKEGFCWASNDYFTSLYEVNERSIQNWLSALKDSGYINISFEFLPGTKQVSGRKIFLAEAAPRLHRQPDTAPPEQDNLPGTAPPPDSPPGEPFFTAPANNAPPPIQNAQTPPVSAKTGLLSPEPVPPPDSPRGEKIFTTPPKKDSPPGEKIFTQNIITPNIIPKTTTTPVDPPQNRLSQNKTAAAGPPLKSIQELKADCRSIDPLLLFDRSFYPKASCYLFQHRLDTGFLSWLYAYCLSKQPRSLPGLFYSLFFAEHIRLSFLAEPAPPQTHKPAPPPDCPVCGRPFAPGETFCPACRLRLQDFGDGSALAAARAFLSLSPRQQNAYDRELNELLASNGDLKSKTLKAADINARYGLPP